MSHDDEHEGLLRKWEDDILEEALEHVAGPVACGGMIGPYPCCSVVEGDCLELMKAIPDGAVDAVITDPLWPNAPEQWQAAFDIFGLMNGLACWIAELDRPPRLAVVIGCNSDPRRFLGGIRSPFFRQCTLEYTRPNYLGRLLYTHDVAYMFGVPPPVREDQFVISGKHLDTSSDGKQSDHPFPRKLSHFEWLVRKWSNPDETILDPFCGSGTTLVAAKKLGRHFLGFEISPEYCALARDRLVRIEAQPSLFDINHAAEQLSLEGMV